MAYQPPLVVGPHGVPQQIQSGNTPIPDGVQPFSTRTDAVAAHIPAPINLIITGGYAIVGDGGGGFFARGSSVRYAYDFTSADGAHWQYIPDPSGWNALVAGVVADGSTPDSDHLMGALLPFQNSAVIFGGGNVTATLLLPPRVMALDKVVYYCGSSSAAIGIFGQQQAAAGGPVSTSFKWIGTGTYPTMFMTYGANQSIFYGMNVDGINASTAINNVPGNLTNCIHVNADNTYSATITTSLVTAGAGRTFHVSTILDNGSNPLTAGAALGIGAGAQSGGVSTFEVVYVTSVNVGGSSFVADCVNNHGIGEQVGGGAASNGITFDTCQWGVPGPFVNNRECGILVGNQITSTVQAAQVNVLNSYMVGAEYFNTVTISNGGGVSDAVVTDTGNILLANTAVQFFDVGDTLPTGLYHGFTYYVLPVVAGSTYKLALTPSGTPIITSSAGSGSHFRTARSYTSLRAIVGGNIKNYNFTNTIFLAFQHGIGGEAFSGSVKVDYCTWAQCIITDILANGAANLDVFDAETESSGQRFLQGTGGAQGQSATLRNISYQSGLPSDFYVVDWNGSLVMDGCTWFSQAASNPTTGLPARIRCATISNFNPTTFTPSGIDSTCCYWQFGGLDSAGVPIPIFYDGVNNPFTYETSTYVLLKWKVQQFNDYGDNGAYPAVCGALQSFMTAPGLNNQAAGLTNVSLGVMSAGCWTIKIPYTAINAAAATKDIIVWDVPARTKIVSVIADITVGFTGVAGTIHARVGTSANGQDLLKEFDISAAMQFGKVDADMGANLQVLGATPTAPAGDGFCPGWTGGELHVEFLSGTGNLSALAAGSLTLYVETKRFN